MKTFNYIARSTAGDIIEGVAEANNQEEAVRQLRESGLVVQSISESSSRRALDLRIGTKKTKEKSLAIVCNQFSILLESGLPIVRTLELIASQTEDKTLRQVLVDAAADVSAGYSLADSLIKNGSGLPTTFVESIRAGEESGSLDTVFRRLSDYYDKSSKTKSKVRSSMVYPTFVIVIAILVIVVIMVFAVPTFKSTFESMGTEMPAITQFVIDTSNFLTAWWWLLAVVVVAAALGVKFAQRSSERFRLFLSRMATRVPVLGRINRMGAASQYAGTMGVMMAAGLPIVKAVDVTAKSMSNYYMSHSLSNTLIDLESGKALSACLADENTLPELAIEMTAVGESTGALENTMTVLSSYYDNEVETATARALSVLEPMIIVILAGVVFVLLLSVYLPMFSVYGNVT